MTIKHLTFDLDDTLWEIHPVITRAEKVFYKWLRLNFNNITKNNSREQLGEHRRLYSMQFPDLQYDLTQLRKNWVDSLLKEYGYSTKNLDEGFKLFWAKRNDLKLFEHCHETLSLLSQHYTLGAITNGNADLKLIGIDQYFNYFTSSSEVGVSKPEPEIFKTAIAKANVAPQQVIHIGDDPIRDILGAQKLGMKTIWINILGQPQIENFHPDAKVNRLDQLPKAIEKISNA